MTLDGPQLERLLAAAPIARLATLGPNLEPHVLPIVFVHSGGALWSPVDGKLKSGARLQRLRNLELHPRCALLLDHYSPRWEELWWIRIDCRGEVLEEPVWPTEDRARIEAALRAKYPQYGKLPVFRSPATAIRLQPLSHMAWSATSAPLVVEAERG